MSKKSGGGRRVTDARADRDGDIASVQVQGVGWVPVRQAVGMADRGELANAHAVHPRDGRKPHLRSNPDRRKANNLDEMAGDRK